MMDLRQVSWTMAAASAGAVLTVLVFVLDRYVWPVRSAEEVPLPPCWHVGQPESKIEILFKDQLQYSEDAVLDLEAGIMLISSDPGRPMWNTVMNTMYDPSPRGTIFLYKYRIPDEAPRALKLIGLPSTSDFHPLGINFFRADQAALSRLFVVNHQRQGSTVDIFDVNYEACQAVFVTSIRDGDRLIRSPNAVVPVNYTSFYVTNDHSFIPRLQPWLNRQETRRSLPLGWITFVDFANTAHLSVAAKHIPFANGMAITTTGKELIVASTSSLKLFIYERDPATNRLSKSPRETIPLRFRPDNVSFDEALQADDPTAFDSNGHFLRGLIVAGHPSPTTLYAMAHEPENHSAPSWAVEVVRRGRKYKDPAPVTANLPDSQGEYALRTLYQSDGSSYPSSSTGTVDSTSGFTFITGLYANGIAKIS